MLTSAGRPRPAAIVRVLFVLIVVAATVWVVASRWAEIRDAGAEASPGLLLLSFAFALGYVLVGMLGWRVLLTDLGSPLPLATAVGLFFPSQVAKYVPGGVWNVVAVAEMGRAHRIPRRRALVVVVLWWLVTIATGLLVAAVMIPFLPADVSARFLWGLLAIPVMLGVLAPPVLNRLTGRLLAVLRRPPLEHPVSAVGVLRSMAWGVLGWVLAGAHVWTLTVAIGGAVTVQTLALCLGGYALAWVVGFLVVIAPAGAGVREAVLGAVLVGQLPFGAVAVVVLLSRFLLVLADVLWALIALGVSRDRAGRGTGLTSGPDREGSV